MSKDKNVNTEMLRRGKLTITSEVYRSNLIDDALFGLKIKVHKIEINAFIDDAYELWFTSPYADIANEGYVIPEYRITVSTDGYILDKI